MDSKKHVDLSGDAKRGTMTSIVRFLGWIALGVMALVTAGHAVSITLAWTNLEVSSGGIIVLLAITGIVLVEVFAAFTALRYAAHDVRAKQTPVGITIEAVWFLFAAVNLISSFAIKHGEAVPEFVGYWVTYGLPVSGLVVAALYYIMNRLDPDAARADDEAELRETFRANEHTAKVNVLNSEPMKMVLEQMMWQTLPLTIGREMGLSQSQIDNLIRHAPQLIDPRDAERGLTTAQNAPQADPAIIAAIAAILSNSTHDTARHEPTVIPVAQPAPGQGNGPSAPRIGGDQRHP